MMRAFEAVPMIRVTKYLKLLGKKYEPEGATIVVNEEVEGRKVRVRIYYSEPWLRMIAELGNLSDFPDEAKKDVLMKLLRLNYDFAEVSFGIDEKGKIYAIEDIFKASLTMDVFEEEYDAILYAASKYFKEVEVLKNR